MFNHSKRNKMNPDTLPGAKQPSSETEQIAIGRAGTSHVTHYEDIVYEGLKSSMSFIRDFIDANNKNEYAKYPERFSFSYNSTLHGAPYWTDLIDEVFDKAPQLAYYFVKYNEFLGNYYSAYRRRKKDTYFETEEYPKAPVPFDEIEPEEAEKTPEDSALENFTMPEGLVKEISRCCQERFFKHSELYEVCQAVIAVRKDPTAIHWIENDAYDAKYHPEKRPLEELVLTLFSQYGLTDDDSIVSGAYYISKHLHGKKPWWSSHSL